MIRLIGFLFTLSILFSLRVSGQGIQFETISFEKVLEKAQKEDKLVFIDFYTTWCAPCKSLDKFVFTDEKVGNLYSYEFVNIKLDAEREGVDVAKKIWRTILSYFSFCKRFRRNGLQKIRRLRYC